MRTTKYPNVCKFVVKIKILNEKKKKKNPQELLFGTPCTDMSEFRPNVTDSKRTKERNREAITSSHMN